MVNTYPISGATLPLITIRGQYGFHVLLQTMSAEGKFTRLTWYIFPLKVIYLYDTAVNGGTKRRNEAGLFSVPKVVNRNHEHNTGFSENQQITH
jgi:hypothetical protein